MSIPSILAEIKKTIDECGDDHTMADRLAQFYDELETLSNTLSPISKEEIWERTEEVAEWLHNAGNGESSWQDAKIDGSVADYWRVIAKKYLEENLGLIKDPEELAINLYRCAPFNDALFEEVSDYWVKVAKASIGIRIRPKE